MALLELEWNEWIFKRCGMTLDIPRSKANHLRNDEDTDGRARIHFGRAGRSVTYLDEMSELSDISLELNELSDTEDGAGLVAGRNERFSAQGKNHNKFNLGRFYTKFDQAFADGLMPICIKKYQQKESKS
ncbi:hypothetical protein YC2023_009252 [Brassica napus]